MSKSDRWYPSKEERRGGFLRMRGGPIPENFRTVGFVPDTPEWRAKAERLERTGRMDEPEDEGRESEG